MSTNSFSEVPNYVIESITERSARLYDLLQQARTASIINGEWSTILGKIAVEASGLCICTIDLDKYIEQETEVEVI